MKNFKILFGLLFIIVLSSCDNFFISDVEPPKQGVEPQLVVHSYLSPDKDKIFVSVKLSKPIFSNDYSKTEDKEIKNAKVTITNKTTKQVAVIPFNSSWNSYVIYTESFPLKEGETHQLNVSTPDGKSVEASCTIPNAIKGNFKNIKLQVRKNRYNEERTQLSFEFEDLSEKENNYGAFAFIKYENGKKDFESERETGFIISGKGKTIRAELTDGGVSIPLDKITSVEIRLFSMDKNYYHYFKTVEMQTNDYSGNPFKEPTIIVSNIKNGLGVFGAYTLKTTKKVFKP